MNYAKLSIAVDGDSPPTEFRIFTAGTVDTVKGEFLFDQKAAKLVLAEYKAHGIDLMIDYAHASLDAEQAVDPSLSGKAAGWFNLELRNGELWAVNVRWTPPAAEALQRKEWRFMSPAFQTDKNGRITCLLNVAITNLPATRRLEPLVAASARGKMDPKLIQQALDAVEKGDAKSALEILKGLIASAAGAEPADDGDDDGSEGDGAEGVAPPAEAAVEDPEVVDAADAPPPSSKKPGASDDDDDDDDDKPAKKMARRAAVEMLCRMTGKSSAEEALLEVETYRASHLTLETERQKLAKDRATLESAERRKLCVELIQLGAEFPATIWADPTAKQPSKLKTRWSKMSIDELKTHVAEQREARGGKRAPVVKPPPGNASEVGALSVTIASGKTVQLSADEVRICKSQGADPKDFAELKARRDSVKG